MPGSRFKAPISNGPHDPSRIFNNPLHPGPPSPPGLPSLDLGKELFFLSLSSYCQVRPLESHWQLKGIPGTQVQQLRRPVECPLPTLLCYLASLVLSHTLLGAHGLRAVLHRTAGAGLTHPFNQGLPNGARKHELARLSQLCKALGNNVT